MKVILRLHRFDEKTTGIFARDMLELNFSVRRNEVNGVSLTVRVVRFCVAAANSHCRVTANPPFGAGAWVDTIRHFEFL